MGEELPEELRHVAHDLGPQLEDALVEACGGRLSDLHWFRTDWQRGGAATGYAVASLPEADGTFGAREVVIKLPLGPHEYRAATAMSESEVPAPTVPFHGAELGGWDLAWIIMEKLPGRPLAHDMEKDVWLGLFAAAAAFSKRADELWPSKAAPEDWPWEELLDKARAAVRDNHIFREQEWGNQLKAVHRAFGRLLSVWRDRTITGWCHGDLHPGNLMVRPEGSPWGPAGPVLLDFAESHCGHWIEDAIYVERIYWAKPELLFGVKPVSMLAKARRQAGLSTDGDYNLIANVRRVMMASVAPAFLHREGHPKYLEVALAMIEKTLPLIPS